MFFILGKLGRLRSSILDMLKEKVSPTLTESIYAIKILELSSSFFITSII